MPNALPESQQIKSEIVLRELQLPEKATATRKALVRWIALSLGLINPGESRLILLDVLDALFHYHFKGDRPTSKEIIAFVKKQSPSISEKSVLYHLTRLKEAGLIASKGRCYMFNMPSDVPKGSSLGEGLRELYMGKSDSALDKIKHVIDKLEKIY